MLSEVATLIAKGPMLGGAPGSEEMRYRSVLAVSSKSVRRILAVRERPSEAATIRPPFDPQEFARESERVTLPPPARMPSDAPEVVSTTMEVLLPIEATTIAEVAVGKEDLEWFELPPLAHKLLEEIDGATSIETICDRAGLVLTDAIDMVEAMAREGIIVTRSA